VSGPLGIPDPGSSVRLSGTLASVIASPEGLLAIVNVDGGRVVVPYASLDLSPAVGSLTS
jgi:hypothetical protein